MVYCRFHGREFPITFFQAPHLSLSWESLTHSPCASRTTHHILSQHGCLCTRIYITEAAGVWWWLLPQVKVYFIFQNDHKLSQTSFWLSFTESQSWKKNITSSSPIISLGEFFHIISMSLGLHFSFCKPSFYETTDGTQFKMLWLRNFWLYEGAKAILI